MGEGSSPQFSLPLLPGPEVAPILKPLASLSSGSHRQIRIIISREGIWILSPVPVRELASAAQASCFHSQPGAATAGVGPRETREVVSRAIQQGYPLHPTWPRVRVSHTSEPASRTGTCHTSGACRWPGGHHREEQAGPQPELV